MNETEALSYLAEIIDAARAGGAPREHIQALQMAREALDTAKANARLFDEACAERDEAIKCIKDYEMYYGRGDEERARHVLEKWMEEESK